MTLDARLRLDHELLAQADEMQTFGRTIEMGTFDALTAKQMRYSSWQKQRGRPRRQPPSEER